MSTRNCRECGKEVSSDAATCPHCGIESPGKSQWGKPIGEIIFTIVIVLFGFYALNRWNSAGPQCVISEQAFSKKLLGGYELSARITNRGKAGQVYVFPRLTSAQGDFYGVQTLDLKAGESRLINYDFDQPYGTATDVKPEVSCVPPLLVKTRKE